MRTLALTLLAAWALFPARSLAAEFEGICAWALAERGGAQDGLLRELD
jgi:hypothetical protein